MGIFGRGTTISRRSDSRPRASMQRSADGVISGHEDENLKLHTADVHDPILAAVNEAQPFEQAAGGFNNMTSLEHSYTAQGGLKDVFGNPIVEPDISNPTRSRNERPLDTIRGFEYAITGDPMLLSQLSSPRYGFNVRQQQHFSAPHTNGYMMSNPYGPTDQGGYYVENYNNARIMEYSNNNINDRSQLGGKISDRRNKIGEQAVFQSPASAGANNNKRKKKKKGFLRRK